MDKHFQNNKYTWLIGLILTGLIFLVPLMAFLVTVLRFLHVPLPVDANQVRMSIRDIYFDYTKAWSELGEPQVEMQQSLDDTYEWYREHGYIK